MYFDFKNIAFHTDEVKPGCLFVALPHEKRDHYIEMAYQKGALAVVIDRGEMLDSNIPLIAVECTRTLLSSHAQNLYPNHPTHMMAVTGTNGKTSVAHFVYQLLQKQRKVACIGTTGVLQNATNEPFPFNLPNLTTLDALSLHRTLSYLKEQHVTHCVFEASSHGLDQHRCDHVPVQAAAFTNLSQDHLDYHTTMKDYFEAKKRLFTSICNHKGVAVIGARSPYGNQLLKEAPQLIKIGYALDDPRQPLRFMTCEHTKNSTIGDLYVEGTRVQTIKLPFRAPFLIENFLAAIGLCIGIGESLDSLFESIPNIKAPCGRMERIAHPLEEGIFIFVDYAHTPDALQRVLRAARPLNHGRLFVVFGCGGDRDLGKRPLMGRIARKEADVVILTDDNPRSEDPNYIRFQIKKGLEPYESFNYERGNREEAIALAISLLREGDTLVIAGKGHETTQTIGTTTQELCDATLAKKYAQELFNFLIKKMT